MGKMKLFSEDVKNYLAKVTSEAFTGEEKQEE
jgi:hypothetical protein